MENGKNGLMTKKQLICFELSADSTIFVIENNICD
jgi:hypothetical protein